MLNFIKAVNTAFFCAPAMCISYKVQVLDTLYSRGVLAKGKGVVGDCESEGSLRQTFGSTNTARAAHIRRGMRVMLHNISASKAASKKSFSKGAKAPPLLNKLLPERNNPNTPADPPF